MLFIPHHSFLRVKVASRPSPHKLVQLSIVCSLEHWMLFNEENVWNTATGSMRRGALVTKRRGAMDVRTAQAATVALNALAVFLVRVALAVIVVHALPRLECRSPHTYVVVQDSGAVRVLGWRA